MNGQVNKAIQELIVGRHGEAAWRRIRQRAGLPEEEFVETHNHTDRSTHLVVAAAAKELEDTPENLLRMFGRFLLGYAERKGLADGLTRAPRTPEGFIEFLDNLDELYARITMSPVDSRPPELYCSYPTDSQVVVHYVSKHAGFEPMIIGLLEGLVDYFGVIATVSRLARPNEFQIKVRTSVLTS